MRVVLDTNVMVSGLAYPQSPPGRIVAAWRAGSLDVVLSPYLLDELARVLPRLNHRLRMTTLEMTDLVETLALLAEVCEPAAIGEGVQVRDTADNPVLALLVDAQAQVDVLVTGDKDQLVLADRYAVVMPAEFCRRHGL